MSFDDVKIRDLSRVSGEWTPPIGVMGGPPAHELYKDLVLHAGLQLFRDTKSRPWVVLRDGAQRRAFPSPSVELRSALDRFRMRRNLRPVAENDIDEFVRIVEARASDPDVEIPLLRSPLIERAAVPSGPPASHPTLVPWVAGWKDFSERPESTSPERDGKPLESATGAQIASNPPARPGGELPRAIIVGPGIDPSISGARRGPPPSEAELGRYVSVLRKLVHDGGWMGTTQELAKLTRDDPFLVFDFLLRYRSELAEKDILIANVEVGHAYGWLAVDRTRIREGAEVRPRPEPLLAE